MRSLGKIYVALRMRMSPPSRGKRTETIQISNSTKQTVIAHSMEVADTGELRRKGLLGRRQLNPGQGLWIRPCESVHTFGMKFAIDLVYLDRHNRIKKLRSHVRPWRVSACFSAKSVLELPSGTIESSKTERGDRLEFSESTQG